MANLTSQATMGHRMGYGVGRVFDVVCITWWPRKLFVSRCVPVHADGAFSGAGVEMETKGQSNEPRYGARLARLGRRSYSHVTKTCSSSLSLACCGHAYLSSPISIVTPPPSL